MQQIRLRGFTLIELLVVIAIIGILSAVVLASLNTARNKGSDARIQAQLSSMRAAAEIYYSNTANSYGSTGACNAGMFADNTSGMSGLVAGTQTVSNTLICAANGTAWAAAANLVSIPNNRWCVDSTGHSRDIGAGAFTNGTFVCP